MSGNLKNIFDCKVDKGFFYCVMETGETIEEKDCSWGNMQLHKIKELHLVCHDKNYVIKKKDCQKFIEFIQYKTALTGFYVKDKCVERVIGWHNGVTEHLLRIKESDGSLLEQIIRPLKGHLHPQSKMIIRS